MFTIEATIRAGGCDFPMFCFLIRGAMEFFALSPGVILIFFLEVANQSKPGAICTYCY
jgi:hypothetical protein